MTTNTWRIELLGELRATAGSQILTRFYTHKIGGLLAYLALHPDRAHPREELATLFWEDADTEQGRVSLRTALASLRRQLEPPGVEPGSVLFADRLTVRLRPEAITTDVAEFDRLIRTSQSGDLPAQIDCLTQAAALYRGDLLSGYYDEWTTLERERLSEAHFDALRRLAVAWEQRGDHAQALEYARRVVHANPFDEAARACLIRLYIALNKPSAARRQYQEWERILREELDETPSLKLQSLLHSLSLTHAQEESPGNIDPLPSQATPTTEREKALPSMRSPDALPAAFTPFFGRKEEIAQTLALLKQPAVRIVTLTGLGGSGKTRLALQAAHAAQESGEQAVYFVPMADITEARLIGEAICSAMRLESVGQNAPLDLAAKAIQDRPTLLILDNFEQLVEGGSESVCRLLEACPNLTCLITSRVCLSLAGEWEFPVAPLPTPSTPGTPEHLLEFAGVQLFVSRAQAARPDFQITAANAQAVAQLCRALEGIPLALELAAARIPALTPAQMLQQMTNRFGFLVARHRDATERHRTLRTALEWSYQALKASHQRLLASLSVFRGGWTLAAAMEICAEPEALDYLLDLRDASLILTEERDGEMRFRMLETVREYCEERRKESGEEELRARHIAFFCRIAEEAEAKQNSADEALWLDRLEAEQDNLHSALDACSTPETIGIGLRLAGALWKFWLVRGHVAEGFHRIVALLTRAEALPRTSERAKALYGAGYLAWYQNDYAQACVFLRESLAIRRDLGEQRGVAAALHRLGAMALFFQDIDTARPLLEESLTIWQSLEDESGLAGTLARLAEVKRGDGDYAAARALQEKSLEIETRRGARWNTAYALWGLGNIAYDQQDYAAASAFYKQALQAVRHLGDKSNLPFLLEPLGHLAVVLDQTEPAVCLFGAVAALRETLGVPAIPATTAKIEALMLAARAELGDSVFAAAWAVGSAMTLEQLVAYALENAPPSAHTTP